MNDSAHKAGDNTHDETIDAIRKTFSAESNPAVERQLHEALEGFREDLKSHPYVETLRQSGLDDGRRASSRPVVRLALAAGAGLACLVIIAVVMLGASTPTWAQVLKAIEEVRSVVVTTRRGQESHRQQDDRPVVKLYVRVPGQVALVSPKEKVWMTGGRYWRYDIDRGEVSIREVDKEHTAGALQMLTSYRVLAHGYERERDLGTVVRNGRRLRLIEMYDDADRTEKHAFYLDPETMLPVVSVKYRRNEGTEPWRIATENAFEFNVPIEDTVFVPAYPETVVVKQLGAMPMEPPSRAEPPQEVPYAVAHRGDKYMAVQDVWLGPTGWVGVKFKTNLYDPFSIPQGFREDPLNQERWNADHFLLHNLLGGTILFDDKGTTYLVFNGGAYSRYSDGSKGYSFYYHPTGGLPEVPAPKEFTFRTIANVLDPGRGESISHYMDWGENPEKWQLFELKFRSPAPSSAPPAGFDDKDLERWRETRVRERRLLDWLVAMRNAARTQEAYNRIRNEPDDAKFYLGISWLSCLADLGKKREALEFHKAYKDYALKKYGNQATERGNLELCQTIVDRLTEAPHDESK